MERSFLAYNGADQSKCIMIHHRCDLRHCTCVHKDNNTACTVAYVGYHRTELCDALGLDENEPVYLETSPTEPLELVECDALLAPTFLIPVHRTTPEKRGFKN